MLVSWEELSANDLRRINVVGLTASGKSTFSRQLADALESQYFEMDQLFHGPNWTEPKLSVFRKRVDDAVASERWVLDGNYHSKTHDLKWARATSIVWIDPPFTRNLWQSVNRAIQRAWNQQELWPGTGNKESFRKSFFSRESIILWAIVNYRRLQKRYSEVRDSADWDHITFVQLRSINEANRFLANLREGSLRETNADA